MDIQNIEGKVFMDRPKIRNTSKDVCVCVREVCVFWCLSVRERQRVGV